jgi:hypothetical protein
MSYFGLHLQTPINDWDLELQRAANAGKPYKIVKAFWIEAGRTVKNISQSTTTVFRHYIEHQAPYLHRAAISSYEADKAADDYILRFSDSLNDQSEYVDYVESLNETYPSEDIDSQRRAVAFDRAFIRRLSVICPNVKPVVYTAPPGNIDHDEYEILLGLAADCAEVDGAFGYHNYWSVVNKHSYVNSPGHARDYQMRWEGLDDYLVIRGIRVNWMLGESGAIGAGPTGYWQKPNEDDVWDGDQDGYLSDLLSMDSLFKRSLAAREDRFEGATLFTSNVNVGWDDFRIEKPFLTRLTDYIIDSSTVTPLPDPDPDPEPEPEPQPPLTSFQKKAWEVTVRMQETGDRGIQLNAEAAIQKQINKDNEEGNLDLQIVTTEEFVEGKTVQAAESLTGKVPRRVYVWHRFEPMYWFEEV